MAAVSSEPDQGVALIEACLNAAKILGLTQGQLSRLHRFAVEDFMVAGQLPKPA